MSNHFKYSFNIALLTLQIIPKLSFFSTTRDQKYSVKPAHNYYVWVCYN